MRQNKQSFTGRHRAPRVQIEYNVETYGAEKKISLPFIVGVLADLSGKPIEPLPPTADRKFLDFDVDNLEHRMKAVKPRVAFQIPNILIGEGTLEVDLTFESMEDFSPAAVAHRLDALKSMLDIRRQLANLLTYMDGKSGAENLIAQLLQDPALLIRPPADPQMARAGAQTPHDNELSSDKRKVDAQRATAQAETQNCEIDEFSQLLQKEFRLKSVAAKDAVEQAVRVLTAQALAQSELISADAVRSITSIIAEIDHNLSAQLNPIIHHEDFRTLEGAWRGLHYFVSNTETDESLKIRVLNISKRDLGKTLKKFKGTAWDQSPIFKKVFEEEYGTFGGTPYGLLVGDYYFDHTPSDVELLAEMAKVCSATHTPFLAGASPSIFQFRSWQDLAVARDLTDIFTASDYAAWRNLRESDESRYLGLAMPRFLARMPYGAKTDPLEEFEFEEDTANFDDSRYCFANSAFAMAANIARSFRIFGWCSRICGVESGGAVEGLPVYTFPTDEGGVDPKCPTEIAITDRREAELAKSGLMPLLHRKNAEFGVFLGAQSLHKPFTYEDSDAAANANLAARLPYVFACARFAHYLTWIARDNIGAFHERADMRRWLQDWIANYVDNDPAHSPETTRAQKPLAAAEVQVEEVEGNPGYYNARLFLRPHYQLESLKASLRVVSRLPSVMRGG